MHPGKIPLLLLVLLLAACATPTPSLPAPTATALPVATVGTAPSATATLPPPSTATPSPAATATNSPAPTATPPPPKVSLSGVVFFDQNGNGVRDVGEPPVPNATLRMGDLTTTSGADGQYTLQGVPQGKLNVSLSAAGFHFVALSVDDIQALDNGFWYTVDGSTKRDWGLTIGLLTLPYRQQDACNVLNRVWVDLDYRVSAIRTWDGKTCQVEGAQQANACSTRDNHEGIDWNGEEGTPIVASAPGTVINIMTIPTGPQGGGGNSLTLLHDAGTRRFTTDYGHWQSSLVKPGQKVARGQVIALMGHTGVLPSAGGGEGNHLHWNFYEVGSTTDTWSSALRYISSHYPNDILDPLHLYKVGAVLDPFRDVSSPSSVSFWTTDNAPQYPQPLDENGKLSNVPVPACRRIIATAPAVNILGPAITADGTPNDWGDRKPLATAPSDSRVQGMGADISALYASADSQNLYLRLDQHGGFPNPPLSSFRYQFDLRSPEWGERLYQVMIPNASLRVQLLPVEGTNIRMNEMKTYSTVGMAQVLEVSVPLEALGNPSQFSITTYVNGDQGLIKRLGLVSVLLK